MSCLLLAAFWLREVMFFFCPQPSSGWTHKSVWFFSLAWAIVCGRSEQYQQRDPFSMLSGRLASSARFVNPLWGHCQECKIEKNAILQERLLSEKRSTFANYNLTLSESFCVIHHENHFGKQLWHFFWQTTSRSPPTGQLRTKWKTRRLRGDLRILIQECGDRSWSTWPHKLAYPDFSLCHSAIFHSNTPILFGFSESADMCLSFYQKNGNIFEQILRNSRKCVKIWTSKTVIDNKRRLGYQPNSLWIVLMKFFLQVNPIPIIRNSFQASAHHAFNLLKRKTKIFFGYFFRSSAHFRPHWYNIAIKYNRQLKLRQF